MADYTTAARVTALTGVSYGASSKPTSTELADMISEVSEIINSFLEHAGYQVPIDETNNPRSWKIVRYYCNIKVSALAERRVFRESRAPNEASTRIEVWEKEFDAWKEEVTGYSTKGVTQFIGRRTVLPDATFVSGSIRQPDSYGYANQDDDDVAPTFTVDMKF